MKKALFRLGLLASAITVGHTAQAQNVTLYGVIDTSVQYLTNVGQRDASGAYVRDELGNVVTSSKMSMESNKRQSSRWGMRGTEDLGGGMKAVFILESGINTDDGTNNGALFGRTSYVGLDHVDYGRLTFGRQYTAMLEHFSAFEPYGVPGSGIVASHTTKYTDGVRSNNSVAYHLNKNGFYFTAVLGMGEKAGSLVDDSTASLGFGYGNKDFRVGVAHFGHRNKCFNSATGCVNAKGERAFEDVNTPRAYTVAGYYNFTPQITGYLGYLQNTYSKPFIDGKPRQKDSMLWGGVKATVDNWVLIAAIYHDRTSNANVVTMANRSSRDAGPNVYDNGRLTTYSLSAEYRLSKRTGIYSQLDLTRAKEALRYGNSLAARTVTDEQATQTALNIGIRHSF